MNASVLAGRATHLNIVIVRGAKPPLTDGDGFVDERAGR
jgi:hypothetical protein